MQGFFWTAAIVALTVSVYVRFRRARTGSGRLSPNELAILALILGYHSNAVRTSAENVLAEPVVGATVIRGLMAGIATLLVVPEILRLREGRSLRELRGLLALTIYGAVAVVSVIYSSAQLPSAGKAVELVAVLLIGWSLIAAPEPVALVKELIKLVIIVEAAMLGVAILGFFVAPSLFTLLERRPGFLVAETMVAPFASSNGLAAMGGVLSGYALASVFTDGDRRRVKLWSAMFVVGTVAVLLSSGRQGVAIWIASVGLALWLHRRKQLMFLIAPLAVVLIVLNWTDLLEILRRDQAPINVTTLSGRTTFWGASYEAWTQHPWTGYGFGSGGRFVALKSIQADFISSVHGGFFEALVGVGLLGILPLFYAIGVVVRWAVRIRSLPSFAPEVVLAASLLLHTTISNGVAAWLNSDVILFVLLTVLAGISTGSGTRSRQNMMLRSSPS